MNLNHTFIQWQFHRIDLSDSKNVHESGHNVVKPYGDRDWRRADSVNSPTIYSSPMLTAVRYEAEATHTIPHKKIGGQFGQVETTTDPKQTEAYARELAAKGEGKAANMRYGQAISEQGVGGMTTARGLVSNAQANKWSGSAQDDDSKSAEARTASGYTKNNEMSSTVGA